MRWGDSWVKRLSHPLDIPSSLSLTLPLSVQSLYSLDWAAYNAGREAERVPQQPTEGPGRHSGTRADHDALRAEATARALLKHPGGGGAGL